MLKSGISCKFLGKIWVPGLRILDPVVDLGNHFATTERDIVEMTNRLAAGGKLAGLTTPEILGLATAMSSVGIEAEAGELR